jgi:uncharacterized protein (DUF2164 family)
VAANKNEERKIQMILKMPREQKMQIISLVQRYFREERDEEIGDLAAELLMDFMIKQIGPFIYNLAINDVQSILSQKMASLEEDVYTLKMPIKLSYQKD